VGLQKKFCVLRITKVKGHDKTIYFKSFIKHLIVREIFVKIKWKICQFSERSKNFGNFVEIHKLSFKNFPQPKLVPVQG